MNKLILFIFTALIIGGCATVRGPEQPMPPVTKPGKAEATKPVAKPVDKKPEPVYEPPKMRTADEPVTSMPSAATEAPSEPVRPAIQEPKEPVATKPVDHEYYGKDGLARLADANDEKLVKIYKGMDKATVEKVMASQHNPHKREKITGTDGKIYEVLFYLTKEPRKGKQITERQLTPVIIANYEVVAIGKHSLKKLRATGKIGREKRSSSKTK